MKKTSWSCTPQCSHWHDAFPATADMPSREQGESLRPLDSLPEWVCKKRVERLLRPRCPVLRFTTWRCICRSEVKVKTAHAALPEVCLAPSSGSRQQCSESWAENDRIHSCSLLAAGARARKDCVQPLHKALEAFCRDLASTRCMQGLHTPEKAHEGRRRTSVMSCPIIERHCRAVVLAGTDS